MEALAAVALLSVGIVGTLQGFSRMSKADARLKEKEAMNRLAIDKLDELVATSTNINQPDSGDFQDRNETRYNWTTTVDTTETTNVVVVTLTVNRIDDPTGASETISTVVYQPATTGTGAAAAARSRRR